MCVCVCVVCVLKQITEGQQTLPTERASKCGNIPKVHLLTSRLLFRLCLHISNTQHLCVDAVYQASNFCMPLYGMKH